MNPFSRHFITHTHAHKLTPNASFLFVHLSHRLFDSRGRQRHKKKRIRFIATNLFVLADSESINMWRIKTFDFFINQFGSDISIRPHPLR